MNAMFNQVEFIHRLEREGIARGAAEAIAGGIDDGRSDLSTKDDIAVLRNDLISSEARTKTDLTFSEDRLKAAIELTESRVLNRIGVMLGSGLALVVAILGAIIAIE